MLDLRLRYEGGGRYQAAGRLDYDLSEGEFSSGDMVRAKVMRPRSVRSNNFFHAIIEAAYENHRGGPNLASWRHLKDWLLIQVGHCNERRTHVGNLSAREAKAAGMALATAVRMGEEFIAVAYDPKRGDFIARAAASTAKLGTEEMSDVTDKVLALIVTEIMPGSTPEEILNEARVRVGRERKEAA
jgi:hypothetical protein